MTIAHRPTVTALSGAWILSILWLWPRAVRAGTLAGDMKSFDWTSLLYACGLGLLGGVLALIVSLASDTRVVTELLKEGGRNAMVSPIAGAAMYLLLEALASLGEAFHFSTMVRFLAIVGAGYAGIPFFNWARGVAGQGAAGFGAWLVSKATPKETPSP